MSEPARDTLAHRWWPGQWLRIVYAVWLEPAWYWYHVRPRLRRGQPGRWGVYAQGVAGLALANLALSAALAGLLTAAGVGVGWERLVAGVLAGMFWGIIFGLPHGAEGLGTAIAWGLPWGLVSALTRGTGVDASGLNASALAWGLGMGLAVVVDEGMTAVEESALGWGAAVAIALGLFTCATIPFAFQASRQASHPGFATALARGALASAFFTLGAVAAGLAGWPWVRRRLPDVEARRQLAGQAATDPHR